MDTTLNEIHKYLPCKPSWSKLLKSLNKTEADDEPLSFEYILKSNGIKDAVWCLRVLPYIDTCLFRADVAESVLHIFENEYPDDNRPRLAIKANRDFHKGKISEYELNDVYDAADYAAFAAENDNDYEAANVASYTYSISYINKKQQWKVIEELFIKHFV